MRRTADDFASMLPEVVALTSGVVDGGSRSRSPIPASTASASPADATTEMPTEENLLPSPGEAEGLMWCAVAHGSGTVRGASSGVVLYEGEWAHGTRQGRGKAALFEIPVDGGTECVYIGEYEGSWLAGMRHGRGAFTSRDGERYVGMWSCDRRNGDGVLTLSSGGRYAGHWKDGVPNGCGVFHWPSGRREERQYDQGNITAVRVLESLLSKATFGPPISGVVRQQHTGNASPPIISGSSGSVASLATTAALEGMNMAPPGSSGGYAPSGGTVAKPPTLLGDSPPGPARAPNVSPELYRHVGQVLRTTTVNQLGVAGCAGTVKLSDLVEDALETLTTHGVTTAPVYDDASGKYVAVLHIFDVMAFFVSIFSKHRRSMEGQNLRGVISHGRRFSLQPISDILDMGEPNRKAFKPLPSGCPLLYGVQSLAKGHHCVHVVGPGGAIARTITQNDVVRFLASNKELLGPLGAVTVGDLKLWCGDVMTSSGLGDKAVDTLRLMKEHNVDTVPIIDTYGAMVAEISAVDIKLVARQSNFGVLQLPVSSFLKELRNPTAAQANQAAVTSRTNTDALPQMVSLNTRFDDVVCALARPNVRQLYFVDDLLHPIGIIRPSDVLGALFSSRP